MNRRYTEWAVETNGITTVVGEWGNGDRVMVLLHGVGSSRWIYSGIAPRLVDEGWHVFAPDFRGSGDSAVSDEQVGRELSTYIEDLVAWTSEFGLSTFVLAGHSFGGRVAAEFAARYLARVERLILIEPAGPDALNTIVDQMPELRQGEEQGLENMHARVETEGDTLQVLRELSAANPASPINRPRIMEMLTNLEIDAEGHARHIQSLQTSLAQRWISRVHDQRESLANIIAPTVVLRAIDSAGPLKYAMPHYADLIPNASFIDDIPGDHALPTNNPDAVFAALIGQ